MNKKTGTNHTIIDIGSLSNIQNAEFTHEALGTIKGKNFLKDDLGLNGMEISLNIFPANTAVPFYHRHDKNEELYIFIKGQGQFQVDDETFDVKEGSMVRVAPPGVRTLRNNSNEDLYYFVVQARANSMQTGTISDGSLVKKQIEWPEENTAVKV